MISWKNSSKAKDIIRDKEDYHLMIKGTIYQEAIIILNLSAFKNKQNPNWENFMDRLAARASVPAVGL